MDGCVHFLVDLEFLIDEILTFCWTAGIAPLIFQTVNISKADKKINTLGFQKLPQNIKDDEVVYKRRKINVSVARVKYNVKPKSTLVFKVQYSEVTLWKIHWTAEVLKKP